MFIFYVQTPTPILPLKKSGHPLNFVINGKTWKVTGLMITEMKHSNLLCSKTMQLSNCPLYGYINTPIVVIISVFTILTPYYDEFA